MFCATNSDSWVKDTFHVTYIYEFNVKYRTYAIMINVNG